MKHRQVQTMKYTARGKNEATEVSQAKESHLLGLSYVILKVHDQVNC